MLNNDPDRTVPHLRVVAGGCAKTCSVQIQPGKYVPCTLYICYVDHANYITGSTRQWEPDHVRPVTALI